MVEANILALNLLKCFQLLFSRKRLLTIPACPLGISGSTLNQVKQFQYLGITFTPDLSWSAYINTINTIRSKTRKLIEVIYHKFYPHSEPVTLLRLYKSLI